MNESSGTTPGVTTSSLDYGATWGEFATRGGVSTSPHLPIPSRFPQNTAQTTQLMSPTPVHTLRINAVVQRRWPRLAPSALVFSLLACLILPVQATGMMLWLLVSLKTIAVLSACSLAAYFEDWLQGRARDRRSLYRFVLGFAVGLMSIITGIFAVYLVGIPLRAIGDGGTMILAIVFSTLWLLSATIGTLLVIIMDGTIRSFVGNFRSRVNLAIMALVGLTASLAYGASALGSALIETLGHNGTSALSIDLGFGPVWSWDLSMWAPTNSTVELMALGYFIVVVLMAMPAVMSASGKLANSLMRNLTPLQTGLEAVARGELDFRIPESGTRDFVRLGQTFNEMLHHLRMAKRMEGAFGAYVSTELLDQIREQQGEANLEPDLRMATVFFADIRGFTSMSERINPKQLLAVLNRFYQAVAKVVQAHEGFLVQYIGDAVVVLFNGPVDQPDHADRATRCAIDIVKAVDQLNAQDAFPEAGPLSIGIGISTGPLVAGNLGDADHLLQYTVLGDTVNQAARLTALAPPGQVWINQRAAEMIHPSHEPTPMEAIKVKGRARRLIPHRVWPRAELTDVTEVFVRPPHPSSQEAG